MEIPKYSYSYYNSQNINYHNYSNYLYNSQIRYIQDNDIPTPDSLYNLLDGAQEDRGLLELIKDWIWSYSEFYNNYITSTDEIEELSNKVAQVKQQVSGYMGTLPQNLSVNELQKTQKEVQELGKDALKLHESRKGLVFFMSIILPIVSKTFSAFYLDNFPVVNNIVEGLNTIITNIESGQTAKVSNLLNETTKMANDISTKLAVKYESIGKEKEQKNIEQQLKELKEWKKQVIDAYKKHKENYMAECERIKKQYEQLLKECKGVVLEKEPMLPEDKDKKLILSEELAVRNKDSYIGQDAYWGAAFYLDIYNNGDILIRKKGLYCYAPGRWIDLKIDVMLVSLETKEVKSKIELIVKYKGSWSGIIKKGYKPYSKNLNGDDEYIKSIDISKKSLPEGEYRIINGALSYTLDECNK